MRKPKLDIGNLIQTRTLSIRDLYFYIKSKLIFIISVAILLAMIGFIKGVSSPDLYTAESQLLPENSVNTGQFGSLTNLANMQLGNQRRHSINPQVYPDIAKSDGFLLSLLNNTYYFEDLNKNISIGDYLTTYHKEDWISQSYKKMKQLLSFKRKDKTNYSKGKSQVIIPSTTEEGPQVINLTGSERQAMSLLNEYYTVNKNGLLLEFTVTFQDKNVAAELNRDIVTAFIEFIEQEQVKNLKRDLKLIQAQKKEAAVQYHTAQNKLSTFQDQNRNLISQIAKVQEDRLRNDFNLAFDLYNQLAKDEQSTLFKIENARPQITIIQEPIVPFAPSNVGIIGATLISAFIGVFLAVAVIALQLFWYFFKAWIDAK